MINNVLDAAEILHEQGIEARVVKINAISPLYDRDMREVIGKTKAMLVAEECAGVGCMGQRMAAILGWNKISPERLELCNLGKAFPAQERWRSCTASSGWTRNRWQKGCGGAAMSNKTRLDVLLVERGLEQTRQRAQAMIMKWARLCGRAARG